MGRWCSSQETAKGLTSGSQLSYCLKALLSGRSAFVADNKDKLLSWYANNPSEYGKLWDPMANDGLKKSFTPPERLLSPCKWPAFTANSKGQ
jgi:hypothetical protein